MTSPRPSQFKTVCRKIIMKNETFLSLYKYNKYEVESINVHKMKII